MIIRRWFPRWRCPAHGQMTFVFLTTWLPLEVEPPRPTPLPHGWWRHRARTSTRPVERSPDRDDQTIDRWVQRGASCCLCGAYPAAKDHWVAGKLLLLCRVCDRRPDALTRVQELVTVDWRETPEPVRDGRQ
jgi:hypothetical protein